MKFVNCGRAGALRENAVPLDVNTLVARDESIGAISLTQMSRRNLQRSLHIIRQSRWNFFCWRSSKCHEGIQCRRQRRKQARCEWFGFVWTWETEHKTQLNIADSTAAAADHIGRVPAKVVRQINLLIVVFCVKETHLSAMSCLYQDGRRTFTKISRESCSFKCRNQTSQWLQSVPFDAQNSLSKV